MHQNKHQNITEQHVPVLPDEVLRYLNPTAGESFLDLTAGYGGHTRSIMERTGPQSSAVLIDRDHHAAKVLRTEFKRPFVAVRQQDFLTASQELLGAGQQFDLILADLGVSSPHLNEGKRGFAINSIGPLDMRMDQSQALTAETIVNTYSEAALQELLQRYGEEPKAKHIAHAIVRNRPLRTTDELVNIAKRAWPGHSRIHPATRTFQALRIAVNNELGQLERSLPIWFELLKPAGRIAIISFHSLEDRLVKQAIREASGDGYDAELQSLTKNPIRAAPNELVFNPRARSAKLRAAVKIKKERDAHAYPG